MNAEAAVENESFETVGKSPVRLDAKSKVTGRAVFIEDMHFRGMLYGKVLRSKHPHARILSIDISRAEALPGVKGVVTGKDLPYLHGESLWDEPFLAINKVRYIGEGVAAVAAVDEAIAEKALELIDVRYEALPAVFEPEKSAGPDAPLIHEDLEKYRHVPAIKPVKGTNICNHFMIRTGDVEKAFAASDHIFEDKITTGMQQHCSIEPHGAICRVDDDGHMSLWANNDSPYRCRIEIARALNLPVNHVRVIVAPYIGGNFGGKGGLKAEAPAIVLAWKIRNRPIRVVYTREEEFYASLVRHPSVVYIKSGVKNDGTILAREVKLYLATGAYAEKGPIVCNASGATSAGPYRIPNVKLDSYCVYTNRQVAGAMRGYGGSQVAWAYESHMNGIAQKMGLDPVDFRLRHVYRDGDRHNSGQILFSEGLELCLKKAAEKMNWSNKPLGKDRGRGFACMEKSVKTPSGSSAFVKVNEDATVEILSSTTEVGQGSETVLCQIVAEELGIPLSWVRKATPDTDVTPFDTSTTSSRSTFHMGNAVKLAAAEAREQIIRMAAETMEANPDDLRIKGGKVFVKGVPEDAVPIAEILRKHYGPSGTVLGKGFYFPVVDGPDKFFSSQNIFWLLGAHGVEVEVNRETGEVKILRICAAHDVGRAIHPSNCVGQIEGGICTALGFAFSEEYIFKDGEVLNPNFLDYKIPTALEVPDIESVLVEYLHPDGPYGAKGVGETANVPLPPAISGAIYDAVGVRILSLPITPDKILQALKEKAEAEKTSASGPA
ncbi:MAG: xanthine dehydrogenase family protein molybdopterin-binding subunit [Desulfobacterales bacterium]|nr:xanthine dehydrogenase family protein molybdopterin-binding subunit [Desulfobacterales bacterium]